MRVDTAIVPHQGSISCINSNILNIPPAATEVKRGESVRREQGNKWRQLTGGTPPGKSDVRGR